MHTKPFDTWNKQKQNIEYCVRPASVKRREVWWGDLGINIGHEQDGGGPLFERPVVILKVFRNNTCLIAPLTSAFDDESHYFFDLETFGYRSRVILTQLRIVSTKRLSRNIERLDVNTFTELLEKIKKMNGFG